MSEAVFITRTPSGKVQLNSNFFNMAFLKKTRISVIPYDTKFTLDPLTSFVAFKAVVSTHYIACNMTAATAEGNKQYTVRLSSGTGYISGEVDVYEFTKYQNIPVADYKGKVRFNLYDAEGNLTFSAARFPLSVPYIFSGSVPTDSNGYHTTNGYTRAYTVDANRQYAIGFSTFSPTFYSLKTGGSIGMYEVVVKVEGDTVTTKQYPHYIGKASSGFGFNATTWGSPYITHFLVDVTNIDA